MRNIALLLLVMALLSACSFVSGDTNGDGSITQSDAALCMQMATGQVVPAPWQFTNTDVNRDGRINSADCALIARMAQ